MIWSTLTASLEKGGDAPDPHRQNVDHLCLRIDPFNEDELLAYLRSQGIAVDPAESRYGAEGDGPSIYFSDPDGNRIELKGPAIGWITALPLMSASRWLSTTRSDLFLN